MIKDFGRFSAAAGIVLAAGSTVNAINYDVTGQAGQYAEVVVPTVVRGTGGSFQDATIYVPFLIDADLGPLQNSAVVQSVNGNLLGGVTTFSSDVFPKWVAAIGTTDAASAGQSNNGFVLEGAANRSNSFGTMLTDGTGLWRANFATGQNNLEYEAMTLTNDPAPAIAGANLVFNPASAGIDGTAGSVFLGTPAGLRSGEGAMLTGVTTFDSFTGNAPRGVCVFSNSNNNPATDADFVWNQTGTPVPAGESDAGVRQTQPDLAMVTTPLGAMQEYICFGVGISGGAAINGGADEPIYFVVDRLDANDEYVNAAYIEADGDNDLNTANNATKFVDHTATGGGTGPFVNSQFSINGKGQVAAILRDEVPTPDVFIINVYNPVWNGTNDRIVGYSAPVEVARSGQDTIIAAWVDSLGSTISPLSGVSISDNGRVAFTAITDATFDMGTGDLQNRTTDLFVWDGGTNTLHSIIRGGQNGDTLSDAFGTNGGDLALGYFTFDVDSDNFNREGLSDDGEYLAATFRNGVENDPIDGGILNPGGAENAVRGVITVDLGQFDVVLVNDCNDNGIEDALDILNGTSEDCNNNGIPDECDIADMTSEDCNMNGVPDECDVINCPGDTNGDGFVNFDDLNNVLGGWNTMSNLCGGDVTGEGSVNFDDLNLVL
ncbi:MAG: hypothetical protein KDA21_12335, partial [Phycisphaerales bacterium]|nr:hypothetical protein [Phycisphaerales bacterium]